LFPAGFVIYSCAVRHHSSSGRARPAGGVYPKLKQLALEEQNKQGLETTTGGAVIALGQLRSLATGITV